jgi:hypothetical protein
MAGLSPASLAFTLVHPVEAMSGSSADVNLEAGRVALWIGCVIGAGIYVAVVYGVHASMVKNFDFTVRKLAGVR